MAARDDISIVTGHSSPGLALAPAPIGEGLGLLALTGSAAVHATFLLGLFVLQPSDAPGVAGENVIEVSVVAEQPAPAFDAAMLSLPAPDEPARPVFPVDLEKPQDAPPETAAELAAPAAQEADAAPAETVEFRLALAPPEEPDGLALPAPLPPAPDSAPAAPSPAPRSAEQSPARVTDAAPDKRRAATRPPAQQRSEAPSSATPPKTSAARQPQPRRDASLVLPQAVASDAPPPPGLDIAAFRAAVAQRVAGMKRYPPGARDRGEEGKPIVAFTLDRAGRLASVSLAKSSGHAELDAETLAMVRRAAPFPAPPPGAGLGFSLGVSFRLD